MTKAKKAYLQGLKDAQLIMRKEYEQQKKENPDNLDGYTYGWLSSAVLSVVDKKSKK